MFESLLLPDDYFRIQKNKYGGTKWKHPNNLFIIYPYHTSPPTKWTYSLTWEFSDLDSLGEFSDVDNLVEKLSTIDKHSMTSSMFNTLKETRAYILETVKPHLNQEEHQIFSKNLKQSKEGAYHDIVTDAYPFCSEDSILYFIGYAGEWRLRIDMTDEIINSTTSPFHSIFNKKFPTRKQGLLELKRTVALYLPDLYYSTTPYHYLESKAVLQKELSASNSEDPFNNWWIFFTCPDIDLTTIFDD